MKPAKIIPIPKVKLATSVRELRPINAALVLLKVDMIFS